MLSFSDHQIIHDNEESKCIKHKKLTILAEIVYHFPDFYQ